MKTNNFKKDIKTIIIFISLFLIEINNSFAAADNTLAGTLNFKSAANNITTNVLTSATTLLMTAAFVLFFYGIVRFMFDRANGDDSKLAKDKEAMLWGLGALFIMVSAWGIIKLVQGFLGIQNDNNIQIQSVSFTPPPSIAVSATTTPNPNPNLNPFNQPTNKPQGANCVGQPGSTTQCASGLYCRDADGNPVATGSNGTCKPTLSQEVANFPTITAPSQSPYIGALFLYLKNVNCVPANVGTFGTTYDATDVYIVQNFQKANGLTQNGIVGQDTWTALFKAEVGQASKCQ